ncbi:sensor histidine kinase [Streptomyces sp. VRA16 Mangrove soil]|uniref:sensor histidine kinase n=1 Tax=Streptomyces sp. VRA16 Mangrove soil TaxID=2817434 RepID=UPI001A9D2307|nr:sensor histidine kinase [Streptomyces sp. VRA16 Mangrove soil]MBO1338052.1 sensor histidine kinase [Streptomyces sp. VRA16 Mangrove soil]
MTAPDDTHPAARLLQRLTQRARAYDVRRPLLWDLLVTGFFVIAALIDATGGGWRNTAADPDVAEWLVCLLSLGLTLPLLWRRSRPLPALAVMAATTVVSNWTGAWLQAALIQFVVVFNIALRLPWRSLLRAALLVVAPMTVSVFRYPKGSWDELLVPQIWSFALVTLAGIAVRSRQDYTRALVERAQRLEIERDQQARLAAAAERARIAREMHDIIGHNLSVITGLADGGSYAAARRPERAAQALTAIADTSRQALTELRRLLDVLNTELPAAEPALTPQPALDDLDALLDGVREAGLPVTVTGTTEHATLPPGIQLAVYRIVQEALTNTLKHGGPGATATVDIARTPDAIALTVTDTGAGGAPSQDTAGRGLTGMRERTALYDGTLEAGPRPTGGWRVTARLRTPKETAL